jgi:uncharacterized protein YydD (DUF2326 family)
MFGMEFDLAGSFTRVERVGTRANQIMVAGEFATWPLSPTPKDGLHAISNENWKLTLAKLMFGLHEYEEPYAPSFRSLISYFIRRDREGGMEEPMKQTGKQRLVDQQVNVSFLMGLDWSVAREWQAVRDREKSLEQLKKSFGEGAFGTVIGSAASIRSELIVAQDRVNRLRSAVATFKVVEEYHDLEREASSLTSQLATLADDSVLDWRYIANLEQATIEETPPERTDLESLYREAGAVLPQLVRRRFDDVRTFHDSVVKNRRAYLQGEIDTVRRRISERETAKTKLDGRRAEIMSILKSAGALEHFLLLQAELARTESQLEALRQKHETAAALESGGLKLRVERAHLLERLRQDYVEQASVIEDAVLTFRRISSQLYEEGKAGTLTIEPTENGPIFDPHIPGEKSKGVNNMRIFCFDMMLMELSIRRGRSPRILIHDSHLFDGVDERQVGKALAVGAKLAGDQGFQYIVTMNSDDVPRELPAEFDPGKYALQVKVTDASEDGGLFGFRFE